MKKIYSVYIFNDQNCTISRVDKKTGKRSFKHYYVGSHYNNRSIRLYNSLYYSKLKDCSNENNYILPCDIFKLTGI